MPGARVSGFSGFGFTVCVFARFERSGFGARGFLDDGSGLQMREVEGFRVFGGLGLFAVGLALTKAESLGHRVFN